MCFTGGGLCSFQRETPEAKRLRLLSRILRKVEERRDEREAGKQSG